MPPGDTAEGPGAVIPADAERHWGTRPGRLGVFTVIGGAFLGLLITVFIGHEPGFMLGLCLILATAVGSFAVRPKAAYMVIPAPALAYVVAAVVAGYLHDHATDTSHTALAISAVQWVANGFVPMATATGLAIVIAFTRWLISIRRSGLKWDPGANARRRAGPADWPDTTSADGNSTRVPPDSEQPTSSLHGDWPRQS